MNQTQKWTLGSVVAFLFVTLLAALWRDMIVPVIVDQIKGSAAAPAPTQPTPVKLVGSPEKLPVQEPVKSGAPSGAGTESPGDPPTKGGAVDD
jgi:hypothetical protein